MRSADTITAASLYRSPQEIARQIAAISATRGARQSSLITRSCIATNEFFSVLLAFERRDNIWICTAAEAPLSRFIRQQASQVCSELIKLGCSWHWDKSDKPGNPSLHHEAPATPRNLSGFTPSSAHGSSKALTSPCYPDEKPPSHSPVILTDAGVNARIPHPVTCIQTSAKSNRPVKTG